MKRIPKVELINPRGRKILVSSTQVEKLLQQGFRQKPRGQTHEYNPVFDIAGMPIVRKPPLEEVYQEVRDFIEVVKI